MGLYLLRYRAIVKHYHAPFVVNVSMRAVYLRVTRRNSASLQREPMLGSSVEANWLSPMSLI